MSKLKEYIIRGKAVSRFEIDVLDCAGDIVSSASGALESSDEDVAHCLEALNARLNDWVETAVAAQRDYDSSVRRLLEEALAVHARGTRNYLKLGEDGAVNVPEFSPRVGVTLDPPYARG